MKSIIINEKNREKLLEAFDKAQHTARVRTVSLDEITETCVEIEKHIGIAKSRMDGIKAKINLHAQIYPNSYNGAPEGTIAEVHYKNGTWRLDSVYRGDCNCGEIHRVDITLTEEAKEAIIKKYEHLKMW